MRLYRVIASNKLWWAAEGDAWTEWGRTRNEAKRRYEACRKRNLRVLVTAAERLYRVANSLRGIGAAAKQAADAIEFPALTVTFDGEQHAAESATMSSERIAP